MHARLQQEMIRTNVPTDNRGDTVRHHVTPNYTVLRYTAGLRTQHRDNCIQTTTYLSSVAVKKYFPLTAHVTNFDKGLNDSNLHSHSSHHGKSFTMSVKEEETSCH